MDDSKNRCAHCGEPLAGVGQPAEVRYHTYKPECRNAGARYRYKKHREEEVPEWETRPCIVCNKALSKRRRRSDDIPEGRWCSSWRCRQDKKRTLAMKEAKSQPQEEAFVPDRKMWRSMFNAAKIMTCDECGRTNAKAAFQHPNLDNTKMCLGSGRGQHFRNGIGPDVIDLAEELWLR